MRRMLSRTLLVLGGAIATTAAAWAISSATAAADPFELPQLPSGSVSTVPAVPTVAPFVGKPAQLSELPVVRELTAVTTELTGSLGRIIGDADPNFGAKAKEAFDGFGRKITEQLDIKSAVPIMPIGAVKGVELPGLTGLTQHGADLADGGNAVGAPVLAAQPVATATTLVGVRPNATSDHAIVSGNDALDGSMTRRGSPEPSDEAPQLPRGPLPLAPLSMPAPVGAGHTGANSVDAPSFGLLSSVPSGTDFDSADASRSAEVHVPVTVGAQPGVTPD